MDTLKIHTSTRKIQNHLNQSFTKLLSSLLRSIESFINALQRCLELLASWKPLIPTTKIWQNNGSHFMDSLVTTQLAANCIGNGKTKTQCHAANAIHLVRENTFHSFASIYLILTFFKSQMSMQLRTNVFLRVSMDTFIILFITYWWE